ncbi:RHS repeat-associated core domain-containing protein [uncultured Modestobacter sp.]|uniref:RHS repeat-associated core domain-containing protein n=1 Tax=uncultured Modestobacter sp. TaxID=380048 RepID=UPI00262D7DB5|nr:RHS repeat-associated core domain-containing protein [uncultured Modestobacter sp.]
MSIQQPYEYRAEHCDSTGCTSSATLTSQVSPDVGIGPRPGASRVPFTIGDQINAQVDVGSGNLMVSTPQLTVPRVAGDLSVGSVYNSTSRAGTRFSTSLSSGWRLSTGSDVYLRHEGITGAVTYYGDNGLTGVFLPAGGDTYSSPAGFKMTLTGNSRAGWTLTDHASADKRTFNAAGQLTALTDRNGNATTFTYNGAALTSIVGDSGPVTARTLKVSTASGSKRITRIQQNPQYERGGSPRWASYSYNSAGQLASITDALGRVTRFDHGSQGNLNAVTAPGGAVTRFTYDGLGRVLTITQPTGEAGVPAVTRFTYSDTATAMADPNTGQGGDATKVPHTSYEHTTDGMKLIAKATDPTGNVREASYTPLLDVASASDSAGSTSFGYDAAVNSGESLTGVTGATGATSSFSYGNSGPAQFQPSSGTDAQGNASTYTYSGAGNRLSAANADGVQATVTYNTDGTVATATSPSGAVTSYTYDANKQLTGITPPADSTLEARAYAYDEFGRMRTYTSGRGITQTYTYDALDRLTKTATSNGGGAVTYDYDDAGRLTSRLDPSGATTMSYDPLGRLTSRVHSMNDLTLEYSYDKTGNLVTATDPGGTTTYAYDHRNLVTRMTLPNNQLIDFGYDADGRRTDTWTNVNAGHTRWAAHTRTDYDAAGRVARVWTSTSNPWSGTSNDATRPSDLSYTYASNGTACSGGQPEGTDTALRQSMTDHTTGLTTTYCYDTANRLTSATTPGGDTFTYSYDVNGNRTQQTKNGAVVDTQTVNAADQLTMTGYAHDESGNTTSSPELGTITYNATEQMTQRESAAGRATYSYAGTNQVEMLTMAKPGDTRTITYGRNDANGLPLIGAYNAEGGTSYIAHDPNGTPVAIRAFTGQTHYYAEDGLGSTTALINQDGNTTGLYDYDPSGEVTIAASPSTGVVRVNPFRYAGGTYDYTSNLIKFGQRWYDPNTGRFTQQDALETLADPTRANRYEYAGGNPVNYVDPTGESFLGCLGTSLVAVGALGAFAAAPFTLGASAGAYVAVASLGATSIGSDLLVLDQCF